MHMKRINFETIKYDFVIKLWRFQLRFNYRHFICIGITLGFLACSVFLFPNALGRLIESGRDFGLSVGYYFCSIFGIDSGITPTVNHYPVIPFFPSPSVPVVPSVPSTALPDSWSGFQSDWGAYWSLWANMDNFKGYLLFLGQVVYIACQALLILIPLVIVVYCFFKRSFEKENNDYDKDSRPLKAYKAIVKHTVRPVKKWLTDFFGFVKDHRPYWVIWVCIWAFNFNLFTIVLEFFAFYFYFVVSFDVLNIYRQVYKLALDLWAAFTFIPWWVWVAVALIAVDRFRKKIAYARLDHFERKNRGFINARPVVVMDCGTMGKKKTTMITDMALSQEVMFRDKAFEKILENDLKFPYFPWCNFENELKRAMARHSVYNLATCRRFVRSKQIKFRKRPLKYRCFGYDYARYGTTYNDALKVVGLWDVLEIYAQLYFVYVVQSSLIISNYSVRVDNVLLDLGNFPLWNSDFFKRDSRLIDSFSRHSHIVDFDALRLGKKMVEDNVFSDYFEFGVLDLTEIGKERKNALELQGVKKLEENANQKNDGFNEWLKMVRHSATIDNFPFVRVICDEQRPESWGADARELCEIIHIRESGEIRLAMPFFTLAELLYGWLFGKFANLYYKYRHIRSDNTLPMYLLKGLTAKFHGYYTRIHNTFDYCALRVQVENGTQDGNLDENKYYIMSKKIYSKRFSTDCFSDFFAVKALRSPVGIDDLREYKTEKATFEELRAQDSYFMNDLLSGLKQEDKHE